MGHFCSSTLLVCVSVAQTGKFVLQQLLYGIFQIGLPKCPNNFKVHYSLRIKRERLKCSSMEMSYHNTVRLRIYMSVYLKKGDDYV